MRKLFLILILSLLCTPCFAIRLAIIADIHYSEQGASQVLGVDGSSYRVFASASARVIQFLTICGRFNPDVYIFLGDLIDAGAADEAAQMTQFKADVSSVPGVSPSGDFYYVAGNHDRSSYGNDVHDFFTAIGASFRGSSAFWTNTVINRIAWHVADATAGFRIIGLATAINFSGNFADEEYGSAIGDNQRDWLNEGSGPLDTALPIIVFSHAHLTTAAPTAGSFAWNSDETAHANVRSDFEGTGLVKALFAGHYHRGLLGTTGAAFDIVNGIPYYGLRASVLGNHPSDITNNTFYIFDIDATGVTKQLVFQKDKFGRSRHSVGTIQEDNTFRRARYSF